MDGDKTMTQILGVDKDVLAHKSTEMSKWLLDSKLFGGKSQEDFIKNMRETYSDNELMFLAIGFVTNKTDEVLQSLGGEEALIKKAFDNAAAKGNIPPGVMKAMEMIMSKFNSKSEENNNKN